MYDTTNHELYEKFLHKQKNPSPAVPKVAKVAHEACATRSERLRIAYRVGRGTALLCALVFQLLRGVPPLAFLLSKLLALQSKLAICTQFVILTVCLLGYYLSVAWVFTWVLLGCYLVEVTLLVCPMMLCEWCLVVASWCMVTVGFLICTMPIFWGPFSLPKCAHRISHPSTPAKTVLSCWDL